MTLGVISCVLWAQSPSKPQPDKKPVLLQEVELPDGRLLRFWMEHQRFPWEFNKDDPSEGFVRIKLELLDISRNAAEEVCRIVYHEIDAQQYEGVSARWPLGRLPTKPPRDFKIAKKEGNTIGVAFLVYPYSASYRTFITEGSVGLDAAFVEVDLDTRLRESVTLMIRDLG
jgi:hypothetical protein